MNSTGYLNYISDMLAKHDAVVIPGFGGFITKYKSARIDDAAGHIHPPAKYIAFNQQLDIHDNTFARYLDEETSAHYSPRLFDLFIAQLKSDLSSNQVIVIPKVGRLYQDFEGQTYFMPDLQNLNNDAFGLPKLDFAKGEWVKSPMIQAATKMKDDGLRKALSSAATVLMLFAMVWLVSGTLGSGDNGGMTEMSVITTPTEVEKPKAKIEPTPIETEQEIVSEERIAVAPVEETTSVSTSSAIIVVGAFGSPANAEKMINRIKELGFDAYRDQPSKLHRVGLAVDYNSEEELDTILSSVQKNITSKAWILN